MIRFENGIFSLETDHLGHYMGIRGELMETLHFGSKLRPTADALAEKHATVYGSAIPYAGNDDLLHLCLEQSPTGKGDYRRTALQLRLGNGSDVVQLRFASHTIHEGSLPPEGLPALTAQPRPWSWSSTAPRASPGTSVTASIPTATPSPAALRWKTAPAHRFTSPAA